MIPNGKATILIDGQFGSTGKGLIAGYLGLKFPIDIAVANLSPNAGHTCVHEGKKYITHQLPMSAIFNKKAKIYIPPGAVIDHTLLFQEMKEFNIHPERVMIHPRTAVIQDYDSGVEEIDKNMTDISSTLSGTGSARNNKISREPLAVAENFAPLKSMIYALDLNREMHQGAHVLIETGQGLGLGLDSGYEYPYVTSKEVGISQTLADCQILPQYFGRTIMSIRTMPIRVGGPSGPFYPDSKELTWLDVGQTEERTTVTNKVRRIATWSELQLLDMVKYLQPNVVFLNFCNYIMDKDDLETIMRSVKLNTQAPILCGWGPAIEDIRPAPDVGGVGY